MFKSFFRFFTYCFEPDYFLGIMAAVAPIAGQVIGGMMSDSSGSGTQAQVQAASPYSGQYQQWDQPLANLVNNPSSVTSTPGYKFNLNQGLEATNRGMAGMGLLGSGNQATALTQYGQDYATKQYQQQLGNLSTLAGVGAGSFSGAQGALQNQATGLAGFGNTLGGLLGQGAGLLGGQFGGSNPTGNIGSVDTSNMGTSTPNWSDPSASYNPGYTGPTSMMQTLQ